MTVLDQLGLFRDRAEELKNTRFIKDGYSPNITIKLDRMEGSRFISKEPNEEDLRSFLLTFRLFVSPKEPVFLNRIYNLCQKAITSEMLRDYLINARKAWKQMHKSIGIKLVYNEKKLTPEYVTDLWINGYYFHNDLKKMNILRQLLPHVRMLARTQFLNFLVEATRQVLYVSNIIRYAQEQGLLNTKFSCA